MIDEQTRPSLLEFVNQQSFDADYRAAAAEQGDGQPSLPWLRTGLAVAAAIVLGAFGVVAVQQNTKTGAIRQTEAQVLIAEVELRRGSVQRLQEELGTLSIDTERLSRELDVVSEDLADLEDERRALAELAGSTSLSGPGLSIVVTDGDGAAGRVRDEDLALLVDGLWQADAQAIAINGQRIVATTAIRNSGAAVHVNGVPLSPPYVVNVLGDPDTLEVRLLESASGARWVALVRRLAIGYDVSVAEQLALPAGPRPVLRFVEIASPPGGTQP